MAPRNGLGEHPFTQLELFQKFPAVPVKILCRICGSLDGVGVLLKMTVHSPNCLQALQGVEPLARVFTRSEWLGGDVAESGLGLFVALSQSGAPGHP
jgi:hypothetical protein